MRLIDNRDIKCAVFCSQCDTVVWHTKKQDVIDDTYGWIVNDDGKVLCPDCKHAEEKEALEEQQHQNNLVNQMSLEVK